MAVFWIMVAAVAAALAYPLARTYWRHREPRIVRCPENGKTASIELDAGYAAITQASIGRPMLRVQHCSRWPHHQDCDQECLAQVEKASGATEIAQVRATS
jgi:hypothetical protein